MSPPPLFFFVLFKFHPRHSYQKMRRWVCITRQLFLRFFSISPLDLPTAFLLPHSAPSCFLFLFSFYFLLFLSSTLLQISKFKKKKKRITSLPSSGLSFCFLAHKVPIFCEDCHPELTEACHNPKDGDHNNEPKKRIYNKKKKKGNPWISLRELWQLFPTHYGAWHAHTSLTFPFPKS